LGARARGGQVNKLLASTLREHEAVASTERFVILGTEMHRELPL
jgi:hypothetical protein